MNIHIAAPYTFNSVNASGFIPLLYEIDILCNKGYKNYTKYIGLGYYDIHIEVPKSDLEKENFLYLTEEYYCEEPFEYKEDIEYLELKKK